MKHVLHIFSVQSKQHGVHCVHIKVYNKKTGTKFQ